MSRRSIFKGSSAAFLTTGISTSASVSKADPVLAAHQQWVDLETHREAIWKEWVALGSALAARHPDFFRLTKEQRGLLPDGGQRMAEIEIEGDRLLQRRFELLPKLCRMKCRTADALLARLGVIRLLAVPEGNEHLSQLIDGAITDLRRLRKHGVI